MDFTSVKLSCPLGEEIVQLSTLDQQAQRAYANLLLVFELGSDDDVEEVVQSLKIGLEAALTEVPEFASVVVPVPGSKKNELQLLLGPESGVPFRAVGQAALADSIPRYLRKRQDNCTYTDLAQAHFPLASFTTELLFNQPIDREHACAEGLPALVAQANMVEGGLIMGLSWHHTVSDARGINTLLSSWARHTKTYSTQGSVGSPVATIEPTRDRWRLTCGARDIKENHFSDYQVNPAARGTASSQSVPLLDKPNTTDPTAVISTWYLNKKALNTLRSTLASAATDEHDAVQFTSGEVVSALVWKHLSLARLLGQDQSQKTSLFASRIDFRKRMKPELSDEYIGNINEPNARTRVPIAQVCEPSSPQTLAVLATAVREAIGSMDGEAMRDFIGLVEGLPSVTDLYWNYDSFPGPDLVVTDMSGMDTLQQEWGPALGCPVCIRSASREKGVAYFLPQDPEGGFEVQLQCTVEDLGRLKDDSLFTGYAQFRC